MSSTNVDPSVDLSKLLCRGYWLIRSLPSAGTDRAAIEAHVAERDPFVKAGLRTFEIPEWLLNEGSSIAVRVSLGTGRYVWS